MAEKPPGPWHQFGDALRDLRTMSGLSQERLGRLVRRGRSTIGAYETGVRKPDISEAQNLDTHLDAHGALVRAWEAADRADRNPSWHREVTEAERHSTEVRMFHSSAVPGRFQIAEYARAVLRDGRPLDSPDEVERSVTLRMKLLREDQSLTGQWLILPESVIRSVVGGPGVHTRQLDKLLELAESGLRLSVLPSSAPTTAGVSGPFRIISFADRMPLVYVEHAAGGVLVDAPEEVRRLTAVFSDMQSWSLDPSASADLIKKVKDDV